MTLYLAEEMRLLSHGADLKWLTDSWGGACASRKVFMKSEEFSCELSSVSSFIVTVGLVEDAVVARIELSACTNGTTWL